MHYDGSAWTPVALPGPAITGALRSVFGSPKTEVWMVGDSGTILYFDGQSWARWTEPAGTGLRGVWYDPQTGGAWIVGDKGLILHRGPATK